MVNLISFCRTMTEKNIQSLPWFLCPEQLPGGIEQHSAVWFQFFTCSQFLVARTSPQPYLYFCMRTELCSFFLLWWAVEIGRASYRTDIYSLCSNWKFSLCKICLEIFLHYDTTWLSHVSCVYLIAPSEGTIILILQRGTAPNLLEQTVRPVSSQKLNGHHTNLSKYKVKKILNFTVYENPCSWTCEPLVNHRLTLRGKKPQT